MWETALVVVIVGGCAVLLGRTLYRQLQGKSGCGCSCSEGCGGGQQEIRPLKPASGGNGCGCRKSAGAGQSVPDEPPGP